MKKMARKFGQTEKCVYFCTRISASAHVWGARGRWFESSNPDGKWA